MKASHQGFTFIELLALIVVITVMSAVMATGLSRTRPASRSIGCVNNLQRLTLAWRQYTEDTNGRLVTCESGQFDNGLTRPVWVQGNLDFNRANSSNFDPNRDLVKSPLWPYLGTNAPIFKCPADPATVIVNGKVVPRLRSMSMSQVFGTGGWLDRAYNPSQVNWRTYKKLSQIALPARTFLFIDEHPDSINDGAFASACTGNQPSDSPASSAIIDYPANYHNGGCGICFTDGSATIHKWIGSKVAKSQITLTGALPLNVPAQNSWMDMHWLAANTTVRN